MADLDISNGSLAPEAPAGEATAGIETYQSPRLIPIGNLHDLLAGGGSQCDQLGDAGNGGDPGSC